ncbi:Serine/arginine repetitive matrix protein 1 [Coemansia helicoidea]|uniref:Serine/arginine repetitive matrix protein 1 n=1 Tax=Coemansia helicoidea TaxID=1286919 RepID=A0ACC1LBU3_9FUNG|nr:Serine/arginine repetitive matrix protein 1 [Coemansia helicoidea]
MVGGFFRGTTIEQDLRYGNASEKLRKQAPAGGVLKKRVDMGMVNMDAVKPWIATRISELVGFEDEVLYEYVVNMLGEAAQPDPRTMHANLTGFLEDKTGEFMQSLWTLLLEAQASPGGIPESLIQRKIEELQQRRDEQQRAAAAIRVSNSRLQAHTPPPRKTRTGKPSRWDKPAAAPASSGTTREPDRHPRTGRSRSPSPARRRAPAGRSAARSPP